MMAGLHRPRPTSCSFRFPTNHLDPRQWVLPCLPTKTRSPDLMYILLSAVNCVLQGGKKNSITNSLSLLSCLHAYRDNLFQEGGSFAPQISVVQKSHIIKRNVIFKRGSATSMFIAAQLTIARLWNQPRCPSIDEWTKKLWYIYMVYIYNGILLSHKE